MGSGSVGVKVQRTITPGVTLEAAPGEPGSDQVCPGKCQTMPSFVSGGHVIGSGHTEAEGSGNVGGEEC